MKEEVKIKNICIKCGVDLYHTPAFICQEHPKNCKGIHISEETLREWANKEKNESEHKLYPMTPEESYKEQTIDTSKYTLGFDPYDKQETPEEAAERIYPMVGNEYLWHVPIQRREGFIEGAKWQQERSYSEEEVIKFGQWLSEFNNLDNESEYVIKELLKRFKKK